MKMNPEVKAKWVAALRSGEYKQIQGRLHDEKGFCCLGVLCAVSELGDWVMDEDDEEEKAQMAYVCEKSADSEVAPNDVVEWAGLLKPDPDISDGNLMTQIASLNDYKKWTFAQIADAIEAQL
jgi:hypothetical protein